MNQGKGGPRSFRGVDVDIFMTTNGLNCNFDKLLVIKDMRTKDIYYWFSKTKLAKSNMLTIMNIIFG